MMSFISLATKTIVRGIPNDRFALANVKPLSDLMFLGFTTVDQ